MYSCTMPVPDPGGGLGARAPTPHEEDVSVLKLFFAHYMYGNGLVEFWVVWGYANRSNSQTSLPSAIGSSTDSRTVLPHAVG